MCFRKYVRCKIYTAWSNNNNFWFRFWCHFYNKISEYCAETNFYCEMRQAWVKTTAMNKSYRTMLIKINNQDNLFSSTKYYYPLGNYECYRNSSKVQITITYRHLEIGLLWSEFFVGIRKKISFWLRAFFY